MGNFLRGGKRASSTELGMLDLIRAEEVWNGDRKMIKKKVVEPDGVSVKVP